MLSLINNKFAIISDTKALPGMKKLSDLYLDDNQISDLGALSDHFSLEDLSLETNKSVI